MVDEPQLDKGQPPIETASAAAQRPAPTLHEADLEPGPSGRVRCGAEIDFATAVARRRAGQNVVVCGNDVDANRRQAYAIESTVGPCKRGGPHDLAGPNALPHYQPNPRPPDGHVFYETGRRKARRKR
jgi:hypothetical protein